MDNSSYKLPSGEVTSDPDRYIESWRAIGLPIAEALGARLVAFDPGFQFQADGKDDLRVRA